MKIRNMIVSMALLAMSSQAVERISIEPGVKVVDSELTLLELLESAQSFIQPISPPGLQMYVDRQPIPYPVDWAGFDKKTTKYMTAEMDQYGLPRYRLLIYEDVVTRDRVLTLASTGFEVARIPSPKDYQPDLYYQYLLSSGAVYSETMRWVFDPAHTAIEVVLYPETLYSAYEEYEAERVAQEELEATLVLESMAMAPMSMMAMGTDLTIDPNLRAPFEEGWLDIHNAEIGQEYEIYYTYNLQYVPFDTNTPSYHTAWPAKIGLIGESDGVAYWSAPLVGENALNRDVAFFRAYEFSDSDGDGLSDIYELMITKTSHTNAMSVIAGVLDSDLDQDGDGLSNYQEYRGLGQNVYTHPRIPDTDNDNKNDDVDPWPMDAAGAEDTDRDRMPDELYGTPPRTSTSYPMLIADPDDDNDRFTDTQETLMGSDGKNASSPGVNAYLDTDGDGLYDWAELNLGTLTNYFDSDNDGIGDGYEVNVLSNSPLSDDGYLAQQILDYQAVAGDADTDSKPQWAENSDSTNPNDGLDFNVSIF